MNERDLFVVQYLPAHVCQEQLGPWGQMNEWKTVHALDKVRHAKEWLQMMLNCRPEESVYTQLGRTGKTSPRLSRKENLY